MQFTERIDEDTYGSARKLKKGCAKRSNRWCIYPNDLPNKKNMEIKVGWVKGVRRGGNKEMISRV
jgi:hypothetical protein